MGSGFKAKVLGAHRKPLSPMHLCTVPIHSAKAQAAQPAQWVLKLLHSPVLFLVLSSLPKILPCPRVWWNLIHPPRANSQHHPLQNLLWFHQSALSTVPAQNHPPPPWIPKMLYLYITYDTCHFLLCVATCFISCIRISSLREGAVFHLIWAVLP